MLKYTTIKELEKLSVSEFGDLLKHYWKTEEFTFVATFVSEKKDQNKRAGSFKNFRKRKEEKSYLRYPLTTFPISLTVPANKPLEEGDYVVPCQVLKTPFSHYPFSLQIKLKSIRKIERINKREPSIKIIKRCESKSREQKNDARYNDLCQPKPMGWGTKLLNYLVGFYQENGNEKSFTKIWTRNFRKIDNYPNSNLPVCPLSVSSDELIPDQVYTFNWEFSDSSSNNYDIVVARHSRFQLIDAKSLIGILYRDSMENESRDKDISVSAVETIKKQVSGQDPCTFLYELLQNANDDPDGDSVEVEIRLTNNMLVFRHTGKRFTAPNVLGICGVGDGDKSDDKEAIGYKGIGFKNVFIRNGYVYIKTGDYSFSFDESTIGNSFMTTPKWEESDQLDKEIKDILVQDKDKFQVNIFMKPRTKKALFEEENNYKSLLHRAFDDIKQILFISRINRVSVMIEGEGRFICSRDTNGTSWVFSKKYLLDIPPELRNRINGRLKEDTNRLPNKMKDKKDTFASFACQIKNDFLVADEKETHVYCGLKAEKAKWGFPFEMNTDMVPTGSRDDIESGEFWNAEWAEIAGNLFFEWMGDLISDRNYNLSSVFRLIPNFELCKQHHDSYKVFIDKFQNGFECKLKDKELIPIEGGIKKKLSDIILDITGLTSSGTISDEDFYKVTSWDISLPVKELRDNTDFEKVLERYLKQFKRQNHIFTKENLLILCDNIGFQQWLQSTEHNNAFLSFLIGKDWLSDFKEKAIFLGENGLLYTADNIFFNIDPYKDDILAFLHHIPFLSLATRNYFDKEEKSLKKIESVLKVFDPKMFVDGILLADDNIEQTKSKLNNKKTSLRFYHFLATNVEFSLAYKNLPYINDNDKVVASFDSDFIFVDNEKGRSQIKAKWLDGISFSFVSKDYGEVVLNYFKKVKQEEGSDVSTPTFGVLEYDKLVIIKHIILNEKYVAKINASLQKYDEAHKSFISFCYANKDTFETNSLKVYALKVNEKDKEGKPCYELSEANIFFKTPLYETALAHPWMGNDWMFSLSSDLLSLTISSDIEELKKFYKDKFGVKDFTAQLFYDKIVCKNMDSIFKVTSKPIIENANNEKLSEATLKEIEKAKICNTNFVSYLDDNVAIVFKDNDFTKFNNLTLLDSNEEFIANSSVTFFYDEKLAYFMSKAWMPSSIVNMCTKSYGHSTALKKMQVNQKPRINVYSFSELLNLVIIPNLADINEAIDNKDVNLDFHNSIIANINSILPNDIKKISDAKVFIQGKKQPVTPASGHKIVSKTVEELIELSIVNYSELDLLDQEYHANENINYWKEALDNNSFTITNFQNWLVAHKESVVAKLQNKTLNIKFWRWAKTNVKDNISCLSELPILVKGKDVPLILTEEIYFSDNYLETSIESLVTDVAPNAFILASDYINIGDEKKEWVNFWTQLGVQQNEIEVLENVIRNRLSVTKVSNLPELISRNRMHLDLKFDNNLMEFLADIQLIGADYQYRPAKKCIFVSCSESEPFGYISMPNRVASLQPSVNSFIGEIIQKHNPTHYITDLTKWRQEKIETYLALQNENRQANVHMPLIKDLAILINANKECLSVLPKVSDIHLLARDNTYKPCKALTEGSKYHPFFDFEACGIMLDYISDSYLSCGESVMKLFDYMKVHHNLEEFDLFQLSDYTTAYYFWRDYIGADDKNTRAKNIKHAKSFITSSKNPFKELVCVPTYGDNVVSAESLYSLHIKDKVALLTDSIKLLPLDIVAKGKFVDENSVNKEVYFMDMFSFKSMLGVQHCFDALCNIPSGMQPTKEKELRKELVKWILNQKCEVNATLAGYRANENAVWNNSISQKQQITELYALNPKDNLEQYFGNNAKIIDASYVANKDNQLEAFGVLDIKVISKTDIEIVPSADKKPAYDGNSIKKKLKFYTLILSGIENPESWKSNYEEYCSKIDNMSFWTCSAIEKKYKYDENVVKKLSGFYHEEGKDEFYYKGDLESKLVFLDYVNEVKKYLDIKADIEIVKRVMDSYQAACDLVECEYGRLLLNDEFIEEVRKTIPRFNKKPQVLPITPQPTRPKALHLTKTEEPLSKNDVDKTREPYKQQESYDETVYMGKANVNSLSQQETIDAQLEAQRCLRSIKPMWKFPDNFAEVDSEGKPYCFSTFKITDEEGNEQAIVLKSYKYNNAPFVINPEEWDYIIKFKAQLHIYRGNEMIEIQKEDLVRNQNSIVLRFSSENLDIEDKISQFSDLLHYFKQIHFDFESFNIPKNAKVVWNITNKNEGTQEGNSDNEL